VPFGERKSLWHFCKSEIDHGQDYGRAVKATIIAIATHSPELIEFGSSLPGASFIVNGATPAKNSALTSAGAELRLANGVTLLGKFDGEFASHSSTYAGTGTIRYSW